jgi:hypothetical protein
MNTWKYKELKEIFNNNKNDCIQTFLQCLTLTESIDSSVWKAIKKLNLSKNFATI